MSDISVSSINPLEVFSKTSVKMTGANPVRGTIIWHLAINCQIIIFYDLL